MTGSSFSKWKKLMYTHQDILVSLLLVFLLRLGVLLFDFSVSWDYATFITIFLSTFTVNFTVFALTKFLVENYPKIKSDRIKKDIDATFKAPIKWSIIGVIATLIVSMIRLELLNYIIFYMIFYVLISSYFVFEFLYNISIKRGKS